MLRRLDTAAADFAAALDNLLAFDPAADASLRSQVCAIVAEVKRGGDAAVLDYARRFDGSQAKAVAELALAPEQLQAALHRIAPALRQALEAAAGRIRDYAQQQKQQSWGFTDAHGNQLGQRITALERVGVYVPGGKASYPSSVLMNVIPAKVAGVDEVIMVSPARLGNESDAVLAAAAIAGVDRVFQLGGAHAIAALAYGTESIPAVDKIVGPGNAWVAAAKREVFGTVGIDMVAGPSEILIICDGATDPEWIALDLFSQAEHDEDAQAILLCPDAAFVEALQQAMERLLPAQPRAQIIRASLKARGALVKVRDLAEAAQISNRIAPEHLELSVAEPEALLPHIRHAGAIFMGRHAPEAFGDYCAGPNHVLPTSGTARFASPLGVYDFQKRSSLIQVSPQGATALAAIATPLAAAEGLIAHRDSAARRA